MIQIILLKGLHILLSDYFLTNYIQDLKISDNIPWIFWLIQMYVRVIFKVIFHKLFKSSQ